MQQRAVVSKEQVGSVSEAISLDTEDSLKVGSKVLQLQLVHTEQLMSVSPRFLAARFIMKYVVTQLKIMSTLTVIILMLMTSSPV